MTTATILDASLTAQLADVAAGRSRYDDLPEGAHVRFAGRLLEDIEAAWGPVHAIDMRDIEWEPDLASPKRRVADAAAVVGLVQFDEGDVALRLCYPYESMTPTLPALRSVGEHC